MKQKYDTLTLAPFSCSHLSINEMIKITLCCLLPHVILLVATTSVSSLNVLFWVILAAVCSELLHNLIYKKGLKISWSTLLQGSLIGLLVPIDYVPAAAFFVTLFVLFFEKMIFTSIAQSWVNTIALVLVILYFVAPNFFPNFLLEPSQIQQHNVGMRLFSDEILTVSRFDIRITNFLNNSIFNHFGISVPEGYITLFWDSQSTIPAFRFNALTLLASIILFLTKTIDAIIPTVFLFTYAFLVYMFSLYPYAEIIGNGDILLALFTGGSMYSAFFLLTWFGTAPLTTVGKVFYAFSAGIVCFLICGAGTSSVGIIFVILLLSIFSPIIQQIETVIYVSKLRKTFAAAQPVRR